MLPAGWQVRHARALAIYRNNYRGGLIDTLRDTTRGEVLAGEAFLRAPPAPCTSTPRRADARSGRCRFFRHMRRQLFRDDPDVALLAALEWAMQAGFVARDAHAARRVRFRRGGLRLGRGGWDGLKLVFVASMHLLRTSRDLPRMWHKLGNGESDCEADSQ